MVGKIPKQGKSRSKSIHQHKIRRVKWLVEEFLERDLSLEEINNNDELYNELSAGVMNNLFVEEHQKNYNSEREIEWFSEKQKAFFSVTVNDPEKIIRYHTLLVRLWIPFKKALSDFKISDYRKHRSYPSFKKVRPKGRKDSWVNKVFLSDLRMYLIDLDRPKQPDSSESNFLVGVGFDSNRVCFSTSDLDVMKKFLSLLEDIPIEKICECEGKNCNHWFVKNYSRKKFCSNRCASRYNQNDLRKNPERIAEYEKVKRGQKARYRKRVLG